MIESASLYGKIVGRIKQENETLISFYVETGDGIFQVKVKSNMVTLPELGEGLFVHIGGILRTYFYHGPCHTNHIFIEARHIGLQPPDPDTHLATVLYHSIGLATS